ncbi:sensor histidine kinase [Yinghuangia seranimata]|uniref:sensor histidine kinase n=1 Tax=Yinghuangia seranimata TaxID=408067 RepID=UPI00248AB5F5|nr:sensor histidine kinase [Yinghuangia seranimata]MDI2130428.1 sensor histidine kinase [Yinghuangia seranimata]
MQQQEGPVRTDARGPLSPVGAGADVRPAPDGDSRRVDSAVGTAPDTAPTDTTPTDTARCDSAAGGDTKTLAARWQRWSQWGSALRRHPWASDIVLVVFLTAAVIGGAIAPTQKHNVSGHPNALNLTIAVLTCLVLLRRRQHPLLVLALTELGQLAYLAADGRDGSILMPTLIALYTVASRERLRRSLWIASAIAVAHTVIRLSVLGSSFLRPENYLGVVWLYLPVAVGEAVRAKRAYWAEVQARLARADHDREEEARRRVTAERMRIARELHDVVAHSIAMINIQAGVAAHVIDQDVGQARQALVHIKEASRDALAELRTTLGVLRQDGETDHPTEPTPGADGIGALVTSYRTAGLPVLLEVSGGERALPTPVGLALYRIVQESLTNAVKHAGPGASATVRIAYRPKVVEVEVTDDGRGGSEAAGSGTGHGVLGMRERATAVGGTLEVGPSAPRGFAVRALLPADGLPVPPGALPREAGAEDRSPTEGIPWSGC